MNQNLLIAGVACIIAAIVGGGLKAFGFEIPLLNSIGRQILLAIVGVGLILFGTHGIPNPGYAPAEKQPAAVSPSPGGPSDTHNYTTPAPEENKPQQPVAVPEQKIIVEASPNPYTINAGEQAEIDVLAYTSDKTPVADAKVVIGAGGGFFSISGNYTELGTTNSNGVFKTYWKSPDPGARAYGLGVTVSKTGFITGSKELTVNIVNH